MIPERARSPENWDFDRLVTILLRQFRRLLAERGVELSEVDMRAIGEDTAARSPLDEKLHPALIAALADIVAESETVLAQWDLTYAQALATSMTDMAGWQTTADFLELANEKINAEVRISAGTSLMVILGDARYAHYLLQTIDHDLLTNGRLDADATIAKRALLFAAGVDPDDPEWLDKIRNWIETRI